MRFNILSLVDVWALAWLAIRLAQDRDIVVASLVLFLLFWVCEWQSGFVDGHRASEIRLQRFKIGHLVLVFSLVDLKAVFILYIRSLTVPNVHKLAEALAWAHIRRNEGLVLLRVESQRFLKLFCSDCVRNLEDFRRLLLGFVLDYLLVTLPKFLTLFIS